MASGWLLVYFFGSVLMDEFLENLLWSFFAFSKVEESRKRRKERIVVFLVN
jgi:hypothetical protein